MWLERARELLVDPAQEMIDFEVEVVPRTAQLMPAPDEPTLLAEARRGGVPSRDGAGPVVGTASGVLFDALAGVFADLGFDALGDTVFRDLVLARIVEPTGLAPDLGHGVCSITRLPGG